jgi:hypothetical protein
LEFDDGWLLYFHWKVDDDCLKSRLIRNILPSQLNFISFSVPLHQTVLLLFVAMCSSFITLTTLTTLFGAVAALPGLGQTPRTGPRVPPSNPKTPTVVPRADASSFPPFLGRHPGDVSPPYPSLNALANYNICPRNGKGYTIPLLTKCLADGMNMGADFSLFVGAAGIGSTPPSNYNLISISWTITTW